MGGQERARLVDLDDDFNLNDWPIDDKPKRSRPDSKETEEAAKRAGFRKRDAVEDAPAAPVAPAKAAPPQRRRRTGRNVQFNIKTKAETIEAFTRIADANGWGLGETFERATELLEHKFK